MAKTAKLPEEAKALLVRQFACDATPTEAAAAVEEEFGIKIGREHARYYNPDPERNSGAGQLAKKWHELYRVTRRAYLEGEGQVAVQVAAFRARQTLDLFRRAKVANLPLAWAILRWLHEWYGDDGGGKAREDADVELTADQAVDTMAGLIAENMRYRAPKAPFPRGGG
jgi:hypothetical protein